jgi:hypothetical protein
MLSIVGMVYSPVRQLFTQVISMLDGRNAMRRIDHLLGAEEMVPGRNDLRLPDGTLEARELVMNWETTESNMHFRKRERLSEAGGGLDKDEKKSYSNMTSMKCEEAQKTIEGLTLSNIKMFSLEEFAVTL